VQAIVIEVFEAVVGHGTGGYDPGQALPRQRVTGRDGTVKDPQVEQDGQTGTGYRLHLNLT
jgi:hypothetical protein